MNIDVLFACVPVTDVGRALEWYERFFDRAPDVVAHATEVMWRATDTGWIYVMRDVGNAGLTTVTLAVADLKETMVALHARGLEPGPIEPVGDAGRKSILLDPDGNSISLIEVTASD